MNVLLLEDDEKVAAGLRRLALAANIPLQHVRRVAEMQRAMETAAVDILVADAGLPDGDSGVEALDWCRAHHPQVRRLLISVTYHEALATSPWELFLPKPFDGPTFIAVLRQLQGSARATSGPGPRDDLAGR